MEESALSNDWEDNSGWDVGDDWGSVGINSPVNLLYFIIYLYTFFLFKTFIMKTCLLLFKNSEKEKINFGWEDQDPILLDDSCNIAKREY